MKKIILILLVVAFAAMPGKSHALAGLVGVEAAVGAWGVEPSGDFDFDGIESATDMEDVYGFDRETTPSARVRVELPLLIPNVYLMATPLTFEGTAEADFELADKQFAAGADTELRLDQYDVALFYGVPFIGAATMGMVNVDLGLNVRILDMEAEAKGGGIVEKGDLTVPVPLLFAAARFNLIGPFSADVELRGASFAFSQIISAIGRVKYHAAGPFFVAAGYRTERVEVDKDGFDVDVDFSGPFAEAGFSF